MIDIQQSVQSTSQRVAESVNTSATSEAARRFIETYTGVRQTTAQPTPSLPPSPPPPPTTAPTGAARPTVPVPAEYPEAILRRPPPPPTTAPAPPAAPPPPQPPRTSISVIVSPSSVKPGETVNVRGIVTRDGQRVSLARVVVSADGYSSTVYTNPSGEYHAVFTIRQDERSRRVTVNVSTDNATASSSFEITAPTPLQTGIQQVQSAITGAAQKIQESIQAASIQVRPEIELRPVAESAFIPGGRADVIRGFQAEMYYRTAVGTRLRKTDANLEVTISGPRSATVTVRSDGTPYDMRDYPPGNYTISARWPGGTSLFLTENVPGLQIGPIPLNSAPATATINITLGTTRPTTTTTPTGVQPSQNLEQEARNRLSQQDSRLTGLQQRYERARSTANTFVVTGDGRTVYSRSSGAPTPFEPIRATFVDSRVEYRPVVPDLMVSTIDPSLFRDYNDGVNNANRLFSAIRSNLNVVRDYITRGAYSSAVQSLTENEGLFTQLEQAIAKMERFIDAVLRNRTTVTNQRPVLTEQHTQRMVTEGRVPTESRTEQTFTRDQTTPGLEVATSSKEAIRNRLAALRAELNSIIGEIPIRENALAALERERGSLMGEIQSLRGRVQELQSRLSNLGSYVSNEAGLRNRIASLRSEVEGLRAQLANLQAIRNDLSMRLMQIPVRF